MVLRKFHRQGLGRIAAHGLFQTCKGRWEIEQTSKNPAAIAFWRAVISEFTNGNFADTGGEDPRQTVIT